MVEPENLAIAGSRRLDPMSIVAGAIVVATGAILGLFLLRGPVVALLAAGALTFAVSAVAAPRAFRIASYVGLVALPFVTALQTLRPDHYNYIAAFGVLVVGLVLLGAFQPRMVTPSLGTVALAYLATAASVALLLQRDLHGITLVSYLVIAAAMYTLLRRAGSAERRLVIVLLLSLAVIEATLAVAQTLTGGPIFPAVLPELLQSQRNYFAIILPGLSQSVTQGSGTFVHFNTLGALLAACLPVALGLWLERRSFVRLAAFAIIAAGLIATFSRGALLGAIAGILFALWFGEGRSRRASILLLVLTVSLVALLGLNVIHQYYQTTQNASIRVQTWQTAVNHALQRPSDLLAGSGYGYYRRAVLSAGVAGQTLTRESTYMSSLHRVPSSSLEFGLLGLTLTALWVVTTFRDGLRRMRPLSPPRWGESSACCVRRRSTMRCSLSAGSCSPCSWPSPKASPATLTRSSSQETSGAGQPDKPKSAPNAAVRRRARPRRMPPSRALATAMARCEAAAGCPGRSARLRTRPGLACCPISSMAGRKIASSRGLKCFAAMYERLWL